MVTYFIDSRSPKQKYYLISEHVSTSPGAAHEAQQKVVIFLTNYYSDNSYVISITVLNAGYTGLNHIIYY